MAVAKVATEPKRETNRGGKTMTNEDAGKNADKARVELLDGAEKSPTTGSVLEAWCVMDALPSQLLRGEVVYAMALMLDRVSRERTRQALERAGRLEKALRNLLADYTDAMGEWGTGTAVYKRAEWLANEARTALSDGESVASEER